MLSKTEKRSLSEIAGEMYHLSSKIECYCVDYENDEDNRLLLRKINNDKGSMGIEAAVKLHMGEVPSVDKVFDVLELTPDEKSFIEVLTAVKSMSSKPLSQLTIDEIASVLASREPLPDEEINRAELTKEFIDLIAHMNSAKVRTIKLEDLEGSE